ncbi:hypothetical protein [Mesorhizobium sp. 43Arga]
MKFPGKADFQAAFGLEPEDEDPSMAYVRYVFRSNTSSLELDVSFSGVLESFQIITRIHGSVFGSISSERTISLVIDQDENGTKALHVTFDIKGIVAEARITFEPDISYQWWLINE